MAYKMSMNIARQFDISSDQTPLMVTFLPSPEARTTLHCAIDSQNPAGLGGIADAQYSLRVQLDLTSQSLVIHETVSGLNPKNSVQGTFRVPIALLEKPKFHNAAGRGNTRIKISFALREGKVLKTTHYKWHTMGTWSNMTARALQMWKYEEWTSNTRSINIVILEAPKDAYQMKGDIERALGLPVNKAPPPHSANLPTNTRSIQSLVGTPEQLPRAGVARIPVSSTSAAQKKGIEQMKLAKKQSVPEEAESARQRKKDAEEARRNKQRDDLILRMTDEVAARRNAQPNDLVKHKAEKEDTRGSIQQNSPAQRKLLEMSASPCTGTSIVPFMPVHEKETPDSVLTPAYQSITFMQPYQKYSFEELRLADYNSGHTMGDLGVADHIQCILAEKQLWKETAAKSDQEAGELRSELTASRNRIDVLETEARASELKYRASLDWNEVLQNTVKTLGKRATSGMIRSDVSPAQIKAKTTSTSLANSHSLYVKYPQLDIDETMDIFDVYDQDKIRCLTPITVSGFQHSFKVDFDSRDIAAAVLKNIETRILNIYADRDDTPEVGHFPDEAVLLHDDVIMPTEMILAPQLTESYISAKRENLELRTNINDLQSELVTHMKAHVESTSSHTRDYHKLREELEDHRKQCRAASTSPQVATDNESTDLLGLDFDEDAGADSTLLSNGGSWLEEYFPDIAPTPSRTELQAENNITTSFTQPTGTSPTPISAPTSPIDPDMILRIDDAVNAVSEEARKALKAGNGVTVQITELDAVPDWLEMVNRRIVIDGMGRVRAGP
jgi:hypothetical protein